MSNFKLAMGVRVLSSKAPLGVELTSGLTGVCSKLVPGRTFLLFWLGGVLVISPKGFLTPGMELDAVIVSSVVQHNPPREIVLPTV